MNAKDLDSSNHLLKEWFNKHPWLSNRISYVTKIDILGSFEFSIFLSICFLPLRHPPYPPFPSRGEYPYPSWWLIFLPHQESSLRKGPEISHAFAVADKYPYVTSPQGIYHYAFSPKDKNALSCSRLLDISKTGFCQGTSDRFSKLGEKLYLRWHPGTHHPPRNPPNPWPWPTSSPSHWTRAKTTRGRARELFLTPF